MGDASAKWPPHTAEVLPWRQRVRGGTKADRTLSEVTVSLPPLIAAIDVGLPAESVVAMERALREITVLDRAHGSGLAALGSMLLRTESVASSKIEGVVASMDAYARALHGSKAVAAATSMVAATEVLDRLMSRVDSGKPITMDMLLDAHERLMRDDPDERECAGRVRDVQNWIGGSDHSPRNALYVPPPHDTVPGYLDDLMAFVNRRDLPVLAQAAIAHAQFESIHPFTDGNGRIGRALMNVILRHREATTAIVVPIASGLVANRDRYFGYLTAYREGDPGPMNSGLTAAALAAATESQQTALRLAALPDEWRDSIGRVRRGSATDQLLERLTVSPVLTADEAASQVEAPLSGIYAAIERLHSAGVLRPLTDRKRDQVWDAVAVLDELDDLGTRIAAAAR